MAFKLIGHHDAAQVGMFFKPDAEQVKHLAFVIVRAGPYGGDRFDLGACLFKHDAQADAFFERVRQQVIAQLETGGGREPVDGSQVVKEVVSGGFQGDGGGANLLRRNGQREFPEVELGIDQRIGIPARDGLDGRMMREPFKHCGFPHECVGLSHLKDPPCPGSS